jgi:hypothetical protein
MPIVGTTPTRGSPRGIAERGGRAAPLWRIGRLYYRSVPLAFVDAASGEALPRFVGSDCP